MWITLVNLIPKYILPKLLPILSGKLKSIVESKLGINKEDKNEFVEDMIAGMNARAAQTTESKEPKPASDLHAAILKLDRSNPDHWAYFGKNAQRPDLDAVEEVAGKRYTVKEVKAVWITLK